MHLSTPLPPHAHASCPALLHQNIILMFDHRPRTAGIKKLSGRCPFPSASKSLPLLQAISNNPSASTFTRGFPDGSPLYDKNVDFHYVGRFLYFIHLADIYVCFDLAPSFHISCAGTPQPFTLVLRSPGEYLFFLPLLYPYSYLR